MTKKRRITKRSFAITAVLGGLIIVGMVAMNTLHSSRQTITATNEAVSAVSSFYLDEMADRRAKTIANLIGNNFDHMDRALMFMKEDKIETQEELRETIRKIKALLSLDRFALVDENDVVYTQYTTYTGGSRHEFLSEIASKDRIVNTVFNYGSSTQLCLAVSSPGLTAMGKNIKACFVLIDIRDIVDLLAFNDQERTFYGLFSGNGENLTDTELGPYVSSKNLFASLKDAVSAKKLNELRDNFAGEMKGSLTFNAAGTDETLSYVPIEGTGWQMVVLIRESMIQNQIQDISDRNLAASRRQVIFTLVSVLILAVVLLIEYRNLTENELEAEKENTRNFKNMANTDSMTGVRNKHAYSEKETAVNEQIRSKELENLGIVVCDVNGLKHVNDTQGHEAGDRLIKEACSLICDYFSHGEVFRVGGDEFVVLLRDRGFETMKEVLDSLNKKFEDNISEGGVVVSMGYATVSSYDMQLSDAFKRADKMMYERKKELKAMGAQTRS